MSEDWEMYYVNRYVNNSSIHDVYSSSDSLLARFVDRDMLMRYYKGFAVGHIYPSKPMASSKTQGLGSPNTPVAPESDDEGDDRMPLPNEPLDFHLLAANGNDGVNSSGSSDGEAGLSDEEDAEISSDEESGDILEGDSRSESSELALEYNDMFGPEGEDDDN